MKLLDNGNYITGLVEIRDVVLKKNYFGEDIVTIRVSGYLDGSSLVYSINVLDVSRYDEFKNKIGKKESFMIRFDDNNGLAYLV